MNWPGEYHHVFCLLQKVTRHEGFWKALCPAHDDVHQSLAVKVRPETIAVKCHGPGCSFAEIRAALCARAGRQILFKPYNGEEDGPRRKVRMNIECVYDYQDEYRRLLYQTVRLRDPKDFRQRRPDGNGGWVWDLGGVRRVPFRLPELIRAKRENPKRWLAVFEGEKDVVTAARDGVVGTCNVCGAGKFHLTDLRIFRDSRVAVFFDQDAVDAKTGQVAGMIHALNVVCSLWGVASEVRLVRLPLNEGKDYSDWRASLPPSKPENVRRQLYAMIMASLPWTPWGPIVQPLRRHREVCLN